MESRGGKADVPNPRSAAGPQCVLFAETSNPSVTIGVVSAPSSLALLAAGVAGIAARRALRSERLKALQSQKTDP